VVCIAQGNIEGESSSGVVQRSCSDKRLKLSDHANLARLAGVSSRVVAGIRSRCLKAANDPADDARIAGYNSLLVLRGAEAGSSVIIAYFAKHRQVRFQSRSVWRVSREDSSGGHTVRIFEWDSVASHHLLGPSADALLRSPFRSSLAKVAGVDREGCYTTFCDHRIAFLSIILAGQ
jgi:hypothetical protein